MTLADQIRLALKQALEVRKGDVLDDECIEDRSRNGTIYILELLRCPSPTEGRPDTDLTEPPIR